MSHKNSPTPQSFKNFLRSIKSAPVSCLLVLGDTLEPLKVCCLSHITGYTETEVSDALNLLSDLGLVNQHPDSSWVLSDSSLELSRPTKPDLDQPSIIAAN
jgi:DNA-binding IclR family transcriptional regulator